MNRFSEAMPAISTPIASERAHVSAALCSSERTRARGSPGVVQSIECNHKDVQTARKGQECAIKIVNHGNPNMTYGRQFDHNHQLFSKVNRASIDALKKYFKDDMQDADWRLVIKLKKVFSVI